MLSVLMITDFRHSLVGIRKSSGGTKLKALKVCFGLRIRAIHHLQTIFSLTMMMPLRFMVFQDLNIVCRSVA